jgi:hypothetical protein
MMSKGTKLNGVELALMSSRPIASQINDDLLAYMLDMAIAHVREKKNERLREYPNISRHAKRASSLFLSHLPC